MRHFYQWTVLLSINDITRSEWVSCDDMLQFLVETCTLATFSCIKARWIVLDNGTSKITF